MNTYPSGSKNKFKGTARSVAIGFGLIFLLLFFWNLLYFQDPKPEESGIVVAMADKDNKEEDASSSKEQRTESGEDQEATQSTIKDPDKSEIKKEAVTDDRSNNVAVQKEKTVDIKQTDQKEGDDTNTKEAVADELKNTIKDALNNENKTGDNGDQQDEGQNDGINPGGKVDGDLGSRDGSGPKITDHSQASGVVVIKVCVDEKGDVISAKFTQRGSTTNNQELRRLAEKNAQNWKFSKSDQDKQCGTITYEFKLK